MRVERVPAPAPTWRRWAGHGVGDAQSWSPWGYPAASAGALLPRQRCWCCKSGPCPAGGRAPAVWSARSRCPLLLTPGPSSLQVIFRFALALFKYKEEDILKLQDPMSIFKYLRSFTRTILDAR